MPTSSHGQHTASLAEPPAEVFASVAEHMLLALEVQCERDGEARYESLTALRCTRYGDCTLFYEVIGDTRWLRTREQALAYIAAKKRGVPW